MMDFYEEIADDYDAMTRFEERLEKERVVLRRWVDRYDIGSVLDAACGTGLHAIVLGGMGIRTVGADASPVMVDKARVNAARHGVSVPWVAASMEHLPEHVHETFDAVFCLGNSLPHLLTRDDLDAAFRSFARLLVPEGLVAVQLLNYHRVLARRDRIVGIHRSGGKEFVRFYDFEGSLLGFNLLTLSWEGEGCKHSLATTRLYPYLRAEVEASLSKAGFHAFEAFGDMAFDPFDEAASTNLVLTARRGAPKAPCPWGTR